MALEALQESLQQKIYAQYLTKTVSVLVEKKSARSNEDMTGHSTCHKVVNFKADHVRPGEIVKVLITQAKHSLRRYGKLARRI